MWHKWGFSQLYFSLSSTCRFLHIQINAVGGNCAKWIQYWLCGGVLQLTQNANVSVMPLMMLQSRKWNPDGFFHTSLLVLLFCFYFLYFFFTFLFVFENESGHWNAWAQMGHWLADKIFCNLQGNNDACHFYPIQLNNKNMHLSSEALCQKKATKKQISAAMFLEAGTQLKGRSRCSVFTCHEGFSRNLLIYTADTLCTSSLPPPLIPARANRRHLGGQPTS